MTERRRSPRYLCSQIVEIRRSPPEASAQPGAVLLEDLSREGAGLALEAALAPGESIELVTPGLPARARVCYCDRRENDFRAGLEFTDGCPWQPENWQPDHLFLPPAG